MAYLFLFLFLVFVLVRIQKNKSIAAYVFAYVVIAPKIILFGSKYDSVYILAILLLVFTVLFRKDFSIPVQLLSYNVLLLFLNLLFSVSCIIYNIRNFTSALPTFLSYVKIILIILCIYICDKHIDDYNLEEQLLNVFKLTVSLNIVALIYQIVEPVSAISLFEQLYFTERATAYNRIIQSSEYGRYFGLFSSAPEFGGFALIALAVFMSDDLLQGLNKVLYIIAALILGYLSYSKTFLLGVPLLLAVWTFSRFLLGKLRGIHVFLVFCFCGAFAAILLNFDYIYAFLNSIGGQGAYIFSFLANPLNSLTSRYDQNIGLIGYLPVFLIEHWMIGVGPAPIGNEFIGDSSVLELLHNGGIIAFGTVLTHFLILFIRAIKRKKMQIIILAMVFATGIGITSWVGDNVSLCIIYYSVISLPSVKRGKIKANTIYSVNHIVVKG
jgi:hypothetical protein